MFRQMYSYFNKILFNKIINFICLSQKAIAPNMVYLLWLKNEKRFLLKEDVVERF